MAIARNVVIAIILLLTCSTLAGRAPEDAAISRGICVVLGDRAAEKAIDLARGSEALIYLQLTNPADVATASAATDEAGYYGTRIFIAQGPADKLHLADNIADALIAGRDCTVGKAEILRVLHPGATAHVGGKTFTKPTPPGLDGWSHPYHGPDNNPQSDDKVIVGPYLTQFLADPRYAPVPQVAVASAGRVFKAFGHVAFKRREEPWLNKLVAFNGYNGTLIWTRDITPGIMVHRNTIIATPETLYLGDDKSCKLIDAATGQLTGEITPPTDIAGGTFWKWMGIEDGRLIALIGEDEKLDPVTKWRREKHGWPWNPIAAGFNVPDSLRDPDAAYAAHPWGFGQNVLAIDTATNKILWHHHEDTPVDSRAMCMKNGRVFIFAFGAYMTCLNAETGNEIWRKTPQNAPDLFKTIGPYSNRQGASYNWRTTAYVKCTDDALYLAGPTVTQTVALSAKDGSLLWSYPYGNFQLIIRDDGLYAIAGQNDAGKPSFRFDPLTGQQLAKLDTGRRACTRPTAASDSIFFRARGGSTRFDIADAAPRIISPMRPPCQDGVTIANGLLYWWPSVCDCQLTLYGVTSLAPAGDFDFEAKAIDRSRLETIVPRAKIKPLRRNPADWPTFRADNKCSASTTAAVVAKDPRILWRFQADTNIGDGAPLPAAPTAAGGLVFTAGPDGIVRAIEAATGQLAWKAYTAGPVRYPPVISNNRAYVAAADGYLHCLEARTGRTLWRFRAAPLERRIPVYGSITSTWPAVTVLVDNGTAYVAAGIVNYDGTYVYALDAATGKLKWQNNSSGHLDPVANSGVSVQGHLLLNDGKLYLPGGNAVSPAIYDAATGQCLNNPETVQNITQNNVLLTVAPRGAELSLLGDYVTACGDPFYAHPRHQVYDVSVFNRAFLAKTADLDILWTTTQADSRIVAFDNLDKKAISESLAATQDQLAIGNNRLAIKQKPLWTHTADKTRAIAAAANAVVIATDTRVFALDTKDGSQLWSVDLPQRPVDWGLAIDAQGRVIVTMTNGQTLCLGK